MQWPVLFTLLLATAAWAREPYLKLHDDTFIPDAVLQVTESNSQVGCIERTSVIVNGSVPGPELRFASGSVVWIRVYNDMPDNNLTMHWHGLTMATAPFADGSPAASQWPIAPLKFFDYEINLVDIPAGSYFYHSHVGFQAITAAGVLIITEKPGEVAPYQYDEEQNVFLSDLYNTTDRTIEDGLVASPFQWSGEVGGVLVNGRGISKYPGTNDADSCSLAQITVEPEKTYRLRFIGANALSFLALGIEEHNLTIIEADGAYTEEIEVSFLQIGGGQRYSALLKTWSCEELASHADGRSQFWIQIETRDRPTEMITYAILDYGNSCNSDYSGSSSVGRRNSENSSPPDSQPYSLPASPPGSRPSSSPDSSPHSLPSPTPSPGPKHPPTLSPKHPPRTPPLSLPPTIQGYLDDALLPLTPDPNYPPATSVTRTVTIDVHQLSDANHVRWEQNGLSWYEQTPRLPYLVALYTNTTRALPSYDVATASDTGYDARVAAFPAKLGEVLDIVIRNTGSYSGGVDSHPMHLHGEHYYYLGSGRGTFDRAANEERLGGRTPVTRDTTMLYRYGEDEEPGKVHSWVAWRVRVEQPGVWMLHCHTLQHMIMGMQTAWVFGDSEDILTVPEPMVEGYLTYGGSVYGDDDNAPQVIHWFDQDDDDEEKTGTSNSSRAA